MLPTREEALKELEIAGNRMDSNKAYIVGVLHDIGRRVGVINIPTHVYEGYKYCMSKGWEVAFAIKEYFEEKMGCSIYSVLPDIEKTPLITVKSWKPTAN